MRESHMIISIVVLVSIASAILGYIMGHEEGLSSGRDVQCVEAAQ